MSPTFRGIKKYRYVQKKKILQFLATGFELM